MEAHVGFRRQQRLRLGVRTVDHYPQLEVRERLPKHAVNSTAHEGRTAASGDDHTHMRGMITWRRIVGTSGFVHGKGWLRITRQPCASNRSQFGAVRPSSRTVRFAIIAALASRVRRTVVTHTNHDEVARAAAEAASECRLHAIDSSTCRTRGRITLAVRAAQFGQVG